ncbi:MAG: UDP-N-acetylmuramoyl-L-alanine--D-glutamate ligase [Alphaproteobacteria bacterium]|nr:UDP-N-acetylmuramoyl-L-alanine--D-glutamate ligase [Alphaproteobacteria bacterium]
MTMFNNMNVALWGFGREGQATLKFLNQHAPQARISIIDKTNPVTLPDDVTWYDDHEGSRLIAEGFFSVIIKSPGVSLYRPELQHAIAKGSQITSGTNLWFEHYPHAKTIAITGTKGKSTTSSLIYHALKKKDLECAFAGNIGTPLLSTLPGRDVTVMELSSYQIADLHHAPSVGMVLNLYPAHGDWHGSNDQYFQDKMRLIDLCQSHRRPVIVWKDDPVLQKKVQGLNNVYSFSDQNVLPPLPFSLDAPHLRLNVSAAIQACEAFGIRGPWDGTWDDFHPLPHRQERLGEKNGVLYVNDSIATIPESTIAALEVFKDRPIYLILGGQEKMQDAENIIQKIKILKNIHVFTIPDNGERYARLLDDIGINVTPCTNLAEAVTFAENIAIKGGVILLSPAAPSYGRFKNFEDRGDQFRKLAGF